MCVYGDALFHALTAVCVGCCQLDHYSDLTCSSGVLVALLCAIRSLPVCMCAYVCVCVCEQMTLSTPARS